MRKINNQAGFTIVELMVALSILSSLLVMSTVILIQLGRLYTKGVNQADTQNAARNIMNDLSSQLQLSGNVPDSSHVGVICMGTQRYTYKLNSKLTNDPASHVLWRDTTTGSGACTALNLAAPVPQDTQTVPDSGVELVSPNMRLTDFSITANSNNTYSVKVTVAYGDDDLVNFDAAKDATSCTGGSGGEFCAVSSLSATVARRIVQ